MENKHIEEAARKYAFSQTGFIHEKQEGFIQGAKWATPKWIKWGEEGSNNITRNSLVLFDNGFICRYNESWPFATVTHFFLVPEPPTSSDT